MADRARMKRTCQHFPACEVTEDLHYAFGYGYAGYFCSEHCPNRDGQEGCDHHEEHEEGLGCKATDGLFDSTHSNLEAQGISLEAFEAFKAEVGPWHREWKYVVMFPPDWTEEDIFAYYEPLGYTLEQVQEMICGG